MVTKSDPIRSWRTGDEEKFIKDYKKCVTTCVSAYVFVYLSASLPVCLSTYLSVYSEYLKMYDCSCSCPLTDFILSSQLDAARQERLKTDNKRVSARSSRKPSAGADAGRSANQSREAAAKSLFEKIAALEKKWTGETIGSSQQELGSSTPANKENECAINREDRIQSKHPPEPSDPVLGSLGLSSKAGWTTYDWSSESYKLLSDIHCAIRDCSRRRAEQEIQWGRQEAARLQEIVDRKRALEGEKALLELQLLEEKRALRVREEQEQEAWAKRVR